MPRLGQIRPWCRGQPHDTRSLHTRRRGDDVYPPPYRFNKVYKDYTDYLGLRYAFVIGVEVEGGFIVNIDDLKWLLDRLGP